MDGGSHYCCNRIKGERVIDAPVKKSGFTSMIRFLGDMQQKMSIALIT